MRFPRFSALICTCFGLIPRMTRLQLRCVFSFGIPLALLVVFFMLHYFLLFNGETSLGIKCTVTGLELLYAWNPCMGGYSSYTSQRAKDLAILTQVEILGYRLGIKKTSGGLRFRLEFQTKGIVVSTSRTRFWIFQGFALVLLVLLTLIRILIRFYFPDCPWCWESGVALKADWLYLQGSVILFWIASNWRDETSTLKSRYQAKQNEVSSMYRIKLVTAQNKLKTKVGRNEVKRLLKKEEKHALGSIKREIFSPKQRRCISLFIVPFVILLGVSSLNLWAELHSWPTHTLKQLSFTEDLLFILGQCVGFFTWVMINWNQEREIARSHHRMQNILRHP